MLTVLPNRVVTVRWWNVRNKKCLKRCYTYGNAVQVNKGTGASVSANGLIYFHSVVYDNMCSDSRAVIVCVCGGGGYHDVYECTVAMCVHTCFGWSLSVCWRIFSVKRIVTTMVMGNICNNIGKWSWEKLEMLRKLRSIIFHIFFSSTLMKLSF